MGWRETSLGLTCDSLADCAGHCADTTADDANCGACGRGCTTYAIELNTTVGGCDTSQCLPTYGDCFEVGTFTTCNQYCASIGESCAADACYGKTAVYYAFDVTCRDLNGVADSTEACDAALEPGVGSWARCCCTDSGT